MARTIRIERSGPFKIEPHEFPTNGKPIWICGCGLSNRMPYCDGTHKACAGEEPGNVYVYDGATRAVVAKAPESGGRAAGSPGGPGEPGGAGAGI
ncbi:MAG: CDGSH iron-sulfur domain-containing protein [Planctomycetota bacterium]|nr:CDGSH iron-sulfur domain-containing protein [Planctomycetota bacterium]